MMTKTVLIFLFFLAALEAQENWNSITASDTVLNFGQVSAGESYNQQITLFNNTASEVNILSAIFEESAFSTNLSTSVIPAMGSLDVLILFQSDQNVNYNDFLRIDLDGGIHPIIIDVSAEVHFSMPYYNSTQNLWGSQLKSTLHNIIDNHTEQSYSNLWNVLADTDEDPNNSGNVILFYTGWSDDENNHGGAVNEWNREHTWAKSHGDFGNTPPAGTDAHHIRPTDVSVNSARGNLDFDNGGNIYVDGNGTTECRVDGDSWEPRDAVKGDVARILYYMAVRYEGSEGYDLELTNTIPSSPNKEPRHAKLSTLYSWHQQDLVDSFEEQRNDRIYDNWQHNRNPFIDYPQFAERLPSLSGVQLNLNVPEISVAPASVDMGKAGFNTDVTYYLALLNSGDSNLNITSIMSTNSNFSVNFTSAVLNPESYAYLQVSFNALSEEGVFNTTIQIESDDSDEALIEIPVTIEVTEAASLIEAGENRSGFLLAQNYPNPFNPKTIITYQLAISGVVDLTIYNTLGQKVAVLVNEQQQAGTYTVEWNAAGFSGGIYLYKLQTDKGESLIKKLVLLK